jgi:peptide/nickel transport system permease protein
VIATIVRRLFQTGGVVLVMSALVFTALYLIGDPVLMMASPEATDLEREAIRRTLGLDKPLWQQYGIFLSKAVHLDFGNSFLTGESAMHLILERMPATLELAVLAMLVSMVVGVPLGIHAGLHPEHWLSRTIMSGSVLGFSLPNFWVGLMLIMLFAVMLGWVPAGGRGPTETFGPIELSLFNWLGFKSLILPALTIATA